MLLQTLFILFILFLGIESAFAQPAPQQASSIFNPNISVVGNGLAFMGNDATLPNRRFSLNEVELGFNAPIDPFVRGDFYVAFGEGRVEVEEGYFTWLVAPGGGMLKAGRFRSGVSPFNKIHPPETAFADRPRVTQLYFGDEGLVGNGISLSYLLPFPFTYAEWILEITDVWEGASLFGETDSNGNLVAGGGREKTAYLTRLASFADLTDALSISGGMTYAMGPTNADWSRGAQLTGVDVRLKYAEPSRTQYFGWDWKTELFLANKQQTAANIQARGLFSHLELRLGRSWWFGGRVDHVEPLDGSAVYQAGLAYMTFATSEFQAISLQGRLAPGPAPGPDTAIFLKWTVSMGPHPVHTF